MTYSLANFPPMFESRTGNPADRCYVGNLGASMPRSDADKAQYGSRRAQMLEMIGKGICTVPMLCDAMQIERTWCAKLVRQLLNQKAVEQHEPTHGKVYSYSVRKAKQ